MSNHSQMRKRTNKTNLHTCARPLTGMITTSTTSGGGVLLRGRARLCVRALTFFASILPASGIRREKKVSVLCVLFGGVRCRRLGNVGALCVYYCVQVRDTC